jgi:hypothetical protein
MIENPNEEDIRLSRRAYGIGSKGCGKSNIIIILASEEIIRFFSLI